MGRPPCCDKVGIKKGPWTPEEDIILVSYIREHGPGNWRSVPTNTDGSICSGFTGLHICSTGLLRCSKSCRLRWTNYLRPGIKRGNFTPHEEGMIIHLQALLGNKWAAIASYLPQRTDNDIKNYWNTHLKKKLKKFQSALDPRIAQDHSSANHQSASKSSFTNESRSLDFTANQANSNLRLNAASSYASSTENISRLLEGWMRSSPKNNNSNCNSNTPVLKRNYEEISLTQNINNSNNDIVQNSVAKTSVQCYRPKEEQESGGDLISNEEFVSILSFENLNNVTWDKSCGDSASKGSQQNSANNEENKVNNNNVTAAAIMESEKKQRSDNNPPLSFLEKWLLDESTGQVEEMNQIMELSDSMF